MRISESMRYRLFQTCINKLGQQLTDMEKKISTQRNINAPSDDPLIFARCVEYDSELSSGGQYNDNLQRLTTLVKMYDTSLSSVEGQLRTLGEMAAGYDTANTSLRQSYVDELKGIIEHLVTVGNTKLGNTYIFGGQQADSAPFRLNNDYSVTYTVSADGEDATNIYVDSSQLGQFGLSGREALYSTTKIAFGNVSNAYQGDIYSNTDSFAYVINAGNRTMYVNGAAVNLTQGVYTGNTLAREIQTQLGANYSVAFDSTTRKFVITNNTTGSVTFNWSNAAATAAGVLGFDTVDSVVASGETEMSDIDTGRKSFMVRIATGGATTGALASRATYSYSTDGGSTWSAAMPVSTGGADTTAGDIVIDGTNNTFYRNGTAVTLTGGTYTGAALATEIGTQLGAGYSVAYDASTRKFAITNSTGSVVNFNWSNAGSTAAGVLGFDNVDSVISNGNTDTGDYDAGMFIDGSGVANATNNRIKFAFGTTDTPLSANDTFQVKDLSVFELLKNFKDAFEAGNSTWVSKNLTYIDTARDAAMKTNAVVAFQGTRAEMLIDINTAKKNRIEEEQGQLVGADTAQLGTEFNVLLNTYQTLLAAFSKMQSISILNYLN
ncbi:MAG: Flagellar hook-associated protein 3 [Syntrophorhabdus sp. PtaB.Bin184]|jgi:flagellin-like hook-associated protein FlgL|nr:MAG: Flagellar hook-associated protein 3 [Syntrophorhabdus sp. PtaB.Bin184]